MFASAHLRQPDKNGLANEYALDTRRNRKIWSALSFQAGWINAGGFMACHRFVTHVTGFATQFGNDIATTSWKRALGMLTVPLFFLGGAMISAYYVDRQLRLNKKGLFHILFFYISLFLLLVTLMGSFGLFGRFGEELDVIADYVLIALLCLSSGIQNAAVSTASANFVRTTHLTGLTTDLGIGLVRMFTDDQKNLRRVERKKNEIRILIILSFVFGTTCGSIAFIKLQYLGFIVPCLISFSIYRIARNGLTKDYVDL